MSEKAASQASRPSRAIAVLACLLLVANLAGLLFMADRFESMSNRLQRLEHAQHLYRLERTSHYDSLGFAALIEALQEWAPWLQKSSQASQERFEIEARVETIAQTMASLPNAFQQIEAAFLSGVAADDPATNDEIRKWLMIAGQRADPTAGRKLLARIARAADIAVSPRLRVFAVEELVMVDKKLAGEILHEILTTESVGGVKRVGGQSTSRRGRQREFFNYVDLYVATAHPQMENTLLRIINNPIDHDTMTMQKCVEALGKMKSREAVGIIKRLYWQQSPTPGQIPNPLFRQKCFVAVMDTLGTEGIDFMEEVDRKESDAAIRTTLNAYKKQLGYKPK